MATFDVINIGAIPNDNTGDDDRDAWDKVNDNFAKAANIEESNSFADDITFNGFLSFGMPEIVTIVSGVATITQSYVKLSGEGASADDLDTISDSAPGGTIVILKNANDIITITQNGNIRIEGSSVTLSTQTERLVLQKDSDQGVWVQISYSI